MPALLPACATLFEVGSYAKHGDIIRNLLIDSPDGLVSMEHSASSTQYCHPDIFRYCSDEMISLELKSPYPHPLKLPVQYETPRYYVIQCITHMALTGSDSNWFGSVGPKSVLLINCTFNEDLWDNLWPWIKEFLDKKKPVAKNWIKTIVKDFGPQLDDYIQHSTEMIGEVPLVHTEEDRTKFMKAGLFTPYHLPKLRYRSGRSRKEVLALVHTALDKACTLMKDSFHIMRAEASKIIAFLASDSTRVPDSNLPPHIPVAYGLKGYSLPMTTMCKMISDVRDQCMDFNVNIRCKVYDGQFLSLVRFSSTGYPLTRLAFLQKYYKELQTWAKISVSIT